MKFIFIYEQFNREYNNLMLLKQEMIRRGHEAIVLNKDQDILWDNQDAVYILPNSYREKDVEYYNFRFNIGTNPVVLYPCEQVTNRSVPTYFEYSSDKCFKKFPVLCWGKEYFEFIKYLGFDTNNAKIVGAVQLDFCRKEFDSFYLSKNDLAKRYSLNVRKKWMLFISDFVFTSSQIVDMAIKQGDKSRESLRIRHNYEIDLQEKLLEWFEKLTSDCPEILIIYRKHPVEKLTKKIKELEKKIPGSFIEISDLNIKQWIKMCELNTAFNTTAAVECAVAGKNINLIRPIEFPLNSGLNEYNFFQGYPRVKSYDELFNIVNNEINHSDIILDKIAMQYSIEERPAFMRIADFLEEVDKRENKTNEYQTFRRFKYLISKNIVLKYIIKKLYNYIYIKFNINLLKGTRYFVSEWNAYADSKKEEHNKINKINDVLEKFSS